MILKVIISGFLVLSLMLTLPSNLVSQDLMAKSPKEGAGSSSKSEAVKALNSLIQRINKPENPPEWLKRTTIKLQIQDDYKPTYELETVQPIFQTIDRDMFFTQLNLRTRGGEQTYSIGIGYRNIVTDWLLLGVNAFYDYATPYDHQRYGFGFEALGKRYEARANSYHRATSTKEIRSGVYQRVIEGYDVEFGGAFIPRGILEDLKIFAGYQQFNAKYIDDPKTYQLRLTYPVTQYTSIELRAMKDEGKAERYFAQLTIGLDVPTKTKKTKAGDIDLKQKLLQPVERVKDIIVEEYASAGGFTVKIKRGT